MMGGHEILPYGVPTSKACEMSATAAVRLGLLRIGHFPGRNGGPVFNVLADVRGALGNVPLRNLILCGLKALAVEFDRADVVAGVAKSGISWAAMLADRTSASAAVINLDGPRASGLRREVEGEVAGRHVLLVDNLIARGESLQKAATVVRTAGGEVVGALTVVADPGSALPFPVRSLWSLNQLIDAAVRAGQIKGPYEFQHNPNGAAK